MNKAIWLQQPAPMHPLTYPQSLTQSADTHLVHSNTRTETPHSGLT